MRHLSGDKERLDFEVHSYCIDESFGL